MTPNTIVETAFISNPNERQLLVSAKWQEEIAQRLFKAFKAYKTQYDASVTPSSESYSQHSSEEAAPVVDEYYGIQIMGLGRLLQSDDPALKGLQVNAVKAPGSSVYKYIYGNFSTSDGAKEALPGVRKKFPGSFVVKVTGRQVQMIK